MDLDVLLRDGIVLDDFEWRLSDSLGNGPDIQCGAGKLGNL